MDLKGIISEMNANAERIAQELLPKGVKSGREWQVGSVNGENGKSMKVCIAGDKIGIWSDFASGESGDLLDLWRQVRGMNSNREALVEVKAFLGIQDPRFERSKKKEYRKPEKPRGTKKAAAGSPVMKYLTEERKLSPEAIEAYKICEVPEVGPWAGWKKQEPWKGPWIMFPYVRDGELVLVKYLHLERRDGKKQTLVEADCEPVCFGWHGIDPKAREIVICEGELDAASLWQYGFPAISVPFGGGKGEKQQWVDSDWSHLEAFETIYLCFDQDKEGAAAVNELVSRLGIHRCKIVTLPRKDANKCLQDGISKAEIAKCFQEAQYIEPEELRRANEYTSEVMEEFYPVGGSLPGFDPPWKKLPFRFLRGEVTIVTATSGQGKSLLWGQVLLSGTTQDERACIASMEMQPKKTLYRLVRQAIGKKTPPKPVIAECLDWMSDKIWLFDLVGTSKAARMLEVFEYAYRRHGIKQFLIDSLMKCGIAEDDYKGQKDFVEQLCDFAKRTGAHIYLVAHSRKGENELSPVGKMDVKGTGAITDLAFNLFSIWRNKPKEFAMKEYEENGKLPPGCKDSIDDIKEQPDAVLICDKARNIEGVEGRYGLWFDADSFQYLERRDERPRTYYRTIKPCDADAPF